MSTKIKSILISMFVVATLLLSLALVNAQECSGDLCPDAFQLVQCDGDTDGDDPLVTGFAGGSQSDPVHNDVCLFPNLLSESYCDGGLVHQKLYNCLDGCVSGACITGNYDTNLCITEDEGDDPSIQGVVAIDGSLGDDLSDICVAGAQGGDLDFLIESYCGANGEVLTVAYECIPSTPPAVPRPPVACTVNTECVAGEVCERGICTAFCAEGIAECSDGLDNDRDGFTDYPNDPECRSPLDTFESFDPECADGIDNDGDGLIDFPEDDTCASPEFFKEHLRIDFIPTVLSPGTLPIISPGVAVASPAPTLEKGIVKQAVDWLLLKY